MKKTTVRKKILSVLVCFLIVTAAGIPAFAAEDGTAASGSEAVLQGTENDAPGLCCDDGMALPEGSAETDQQAEEAQPVEEAAENGAEEDPAFAINGNSELPEETPALEEEASSEETDSGTEAAIPDAEAGEDPDQYPEAAEDPEENAEDEAPAPETAGPEVPADPEDADAGAGLPAAEEPKELLTDTEDTENDVPEVAEPEEDPEGSKETEEDGGTEAADRSDPEAVSEKTGPDRPDSESAAGTEEARGAADEAEARGAADEAETRGAADTAKVQRSADTAEKEPAKAALAAKENTKKDQKKGNARENAKGADEEEPQQETVFSVSYLAENGTVSPGTEVSLPSGSRPSGAIFAPSPGYYFTGWTTDQDLTEEDGASQTYAAGDPIEMSEIRALTVTKDLSFTAHSEERTGQVQTGARPKIAFFGDSITSGVNGERKITGVRHVETTYPRAISLLMDVEYKNYGLGNIGWIGLTDLTDVNAYQVITSKNLTGFDDIVICLGVNDGAYTIGDWDSTDETTVMGQFNKTMQYLVSQNEIGQVILVAPWYTARSKRELLTAAMAQAAEFYGFPFIEQTDNPVDQEVIRANYPDGTHPTQEYYLQIGEWLAGKLQPLIGAPWKSVLYGLDVAYPSLVYTGAMRTQTNDLKVIGTSNGHFTTVERANYKVTYENSTNVGTATMTVTGKGPYAKQTLAENFEITPAPLTAAILQYDRLVYTGDARTQSGTTVVKRKDSILTRGTDYKITYKNYVNVGTVTMIITGKGNYGGTLTRTFLIVPNTVTVKSVTSGTKTMTVKWAKQAEQTTGYKLQYSTDKNFTSGIRTVTIDDVSVLTKTISSLKSNVRYYIRMRAGILGTKYVSSWSRTATVVVK